MLPFIKPKKGFQFAGSGLDAGSSGGGGGGGGSSFPDFSTTEVDTGIKWIDGSSVYMRTFHQTNADYYFNISELTDANNFVIDAFAMGKETSYNTWFSYDGGWALGSQLSFKQTSGSPTYTSERYATVLYIKKGENT